MGKIIDKGFAHKIAEEILSKLKYRVNDRYFNTEEEMNEYLNSEDVCADYYGGDDYSESICEFDE